MHGIDVLIAQGKMRLHELCEEIWHYK